MSIKSVEGLKILSYPFKGVFEDATGITQDVDGLALVVSNVGLWIDGNGDLVLGITKQDALQMARYFLNVGLE